MSLVAEILGFLSLSFKVGLLALALLFLYWFWEALQRRDRTLVQDGRRLVDWLGCGSRSAIPAYWENAGKDLTQAYHRSSPDFFDDLYPVPLRDREALQSLIDETIGDDTKQFRLIRAVRVENSRMWAKYQVKAAEIEKKQLDSPREFAGRGAPRTVEALEDIEGAEGTFAHSLDEELCEAYLWHGTGPDAAMHITEQGFNVALSNVGRYGRGCYLAEDFAKADQYATAGQGIYTECYAMLLCRVVLGSQLLITADVDVGAASTASRAGFDSALAELPPLGGEEREGEEPRPREFVVTDSTQVYPEYALIYERRRPAEEEATSECQEAEPSYVGGFFSWLMGLEGQRDASSVPGYWLNSEQPPGSSFHDIVPAAGARQRLQEVMDSTWLHRWTRDRKNSRGERIPAGDPHSDMPMGVNVLKAWRVEDSGMWRAYRESQERIRSSRGDCSESGPGEVRSVAALPFREQRRCAQDVNEVYLFHGSSPHAVTCIAEQGFNVDLSGSNTSAAFGRGAYFCESSSKADEYSKDQPDGYYKGYYAMLLCRVTLGKVQVLEEFDDQACSRVGHDREFDSTLGDREAVANTYREFVVPSAAQIYPEYAIIYERLYRRPRVRGLRHFPMEAGSPAAAASGPHASDSVSAAPAATPSEALAVAAAGLGAMTPLFPHSIGRQPAAPCQSFSWPTPAAPKGPLQVV